MPEVWEQEGHFRARPCFRGDIEEELKRVDVDRQRTEAARTTTGTAAAAKTTATPTIKRSADSHKASQDQSPLAPGALVRTATFSAA